METHGETMNYALPHPSTDENSADVGRADKLELDALLSQRTSILKTKLEVIASELQDRLRIRGDNLARIGEDEERATTMLETVARQADYHLRDQRDKSAFYDLLFTLKREKREEEVECWRDTTQLMRDFLEVWEALQQAKNKSIFFQE